MLGIARALGELALGLGCLAAVGFVCWLIYAGIRKLVQDRRNYR